MNSSRMIQGTAVVAIAIIIAAPALAQSRGQANYQAGYGNARQATAQNTTGSTRDGNGNRLIVDGIIQSGASSYSRQTGGVSSSYSGVGGQGGYTGGSTAIGNNLNVVVQGNRNTVIVNSTQNNSGTVTAGTNVNGTPRAQ